MERVVVKRRALCATRKNSFKKVEPETETNTRILLKDTTFPIQPYIGSSRNHQHPSCFSAHRFLKSPGSSNWLSKFSAHQVLGFLLRTSQGCLFQHMPPSTKKPLVRLRATTWVGISKRKPRFASGSEAERKPFHATPNEPREQLLPIHAGARAASPTRARSVSPSQPPPQTCMSTSWGHSPRRRCQPRWKTPTALRLPPFWHRSPKPPQRQRPPPEPPPFSQPPASLCYLPRTRLKRRLRRLPSTRIACQLLVFFF